MSLISLPRRHSTPPPASARPKRLGLIEWKDETGAKIQQQAALDTDRVRGLTAVVRQAPPLVTIAQVLEEGSSYSVQVLSTQEVEGGFELDLDYVWEGRRRERRKGVSGPAMLKPDGLAEMQVDVVNVSAGGMRLFSLCPAPIGSSAKILGSDTERLSFIRSCIAAPGGYFIGVQFYGETRKEESHGDK